MRHHLQRADERVLLGYRTTGPGHRSELCEDVGDEFVDQHDGTATDDLMILFTSEAEDGDFFDRSFRGNTMKERPNVLFSRLELSHAPTLALGPRVGVH